MRSARIEYTREMDVYGSHCPLSDQHCSVGWEALSREGTPGIFGRRFWVWEGWMAEKAERPRGNAS